MPQPGKDTVYFDLETQRSAQDVGGWAHKDKMGMSIGVTFSTRDNEYRIYREQEVDALVEQLMRADLVVGFNHIGFDYPVLLGYTIYDLPAMTVNLDILVDLEKQLGFRVSLEDVAQCTLGTGKTAEGLQAIVWWREGKLREIAEYCAYDVKVTRLVHEYGIRHGHVKLRDRNSGAERQVPVDWK